MTTGCPPLIVHVVPQRPFLATNASFVNIHVFMISGSTLNKSAKRLLRL